MAMKFPGFPLFQAKKSQPRFRKVNRSLPSWWMTPVYLDHSQSFSGGDDVWDPAQQKDLVMGENVMGDHRFTDSSLFLVLLSIFRGATF